MFSTRIVAAPSPPTGMRGARGNNEAQDWANKRKAAMERAAQLREQRKNGGGSNPEEETFAPQINRRPSYLKPVDSLDQLAGNVQRDPNDIFEQPLPGARGAQAFASEFNVPKLPSPGSDTLGREIKKYPSTGVHNDENRNTQVPYKSKFLQQYGAEQATETDSSYGARQQPANRNMAQQEVVHRTPVKVQEEADAAFMSSLRGNNSGSGKKASAPAFSGPGWNDDVSSNGFGAPPKIKSAPTRRPRQEAPDPTPPPREYEQEPTQPSRPGRRAAQPSQQREWNMDTEVAYNAAPRALPPTSPRVSPRVPAQRSRTDAAGAAVAAQPNLSLLKSKIRRSSSGQSMTSLQASSTSNLSNWEDSNQDNYAAEQVADIKRNGRRSAPNPSFPSDNDASGQGSYAAGARGNRGAATRPTGYSNYQQQEVDPYAAPYEPATLPQRPRVRDPPQQAAAPPAQRPQPRQQQEPPVQVAAASRRPAANAPPANDPFGPDAYPPGASFGIPEQPEFGPNDMQQCPHCPRMFNPIAFEKHVNICQKVFGQKRKVFNAAAQRLDTDDPEMQKLAAAAAKAAAKQAAADKRKAAMEEQAAAMGRAPAKPAAAAAQPYNSRWDDPPAPAAKAAPQKARPAARDSAPVGGAGGGGGGEGGGNPKWKAESNAFREAMRAAREYAKAKAEGKPLPPPVASAPDPSLTPCPHCGRSFNEKAAQRHIPQCQNIKAKPTTLRRGAGGGGGLNGTATGGSGKAKRGFMG